MTADERTKVRRAAEQLQGVATDLERGPNADEDTGGYELRVATLLRVIAEELGNLAGDPPADADE